MDTRFTYDEKDLDGNGFVSMSEAGYFSESGSQNIEIDGMACIEYFAYKDGSRLKVVCDEKGL